ncbi:MAG: tetratricopeptide repeat protein, partial [Thermodesulfobacteriota bacterium]
KEVLSLTKDKEPLPTGQAPNRAGSGQAGAEGLPYAGATLSGRPSSPRGEKESPDEPRPSLNEKRGEPPIKQVAVEKKVIKPVTPLSPAPSTSLKEKTSAKGIEVKREPDKDRPFASEILHHFNSGVQFYNQREFSKAIQAYQKVVELDTTYIEAYNNLGIIYQEMGDLESAFKAFQKSIEINPRYEKAFNNLGIVFYTSGRHEEAVVAFQKALTINPNNIESHINLGILFKKQGESGKAIESFQKALSINPLCGEIHYNIAILYEQLENIDLAIGHYRQFIQISSKSHPALVSKVQKHLNELMKGRKDK